MAERTKQPPINLDELEEEVGEEKRGSISYVNGGDNPKKPRGGGGKFPKLGKSKGGAIGVLQVFIPILAAVVIAFLLINAMAVNKGTYSTGITTLQESVDTRLAVMDTKVSNVINSYASKSDLTGFVKSSDLSGYAAAGALTTVQQQIAALQSQVGGITPLTQAQIQAMITQALGNTSNYVTKSQLDTAVATAVNYLKTLIGGSVVNYSLIGTGDTYAILVGPNAAGNYTGEINLAYTPGPATKLGSTYVSAVSTFYTVTLGSYTPTITLGVDSFYYLTGVVVTSPAYSLTASQVQYIQLKGLYDFGVPSGVVIK